MKNMMRIKEEIPKHEKNEWGYPLAEFWRFIGFQRGAGRYIEIPRAEEEE